MLAPRIVGIGSPRYRVGLGDATTDLYGTASSDLTAGAVSAANSAVSSLPPEVQQAMSVGRQVISNGKPAIDLISLISSHQPIDAVDLETKVIAAEAAIAGMVYPPAGALMAAAGALSIGLQQGLIAIFGALGLLSQPPKTWKYLGLIRQDADTTPASPSDPAWIHISNRLDLYNFIMNGRVEISQAQADLAKSAFGQTWAPQTGYPALEYSGDQQEGMQTFLDLWQMALLRRAPPDKTIWSQAFAFSCNLGTPNPLNKQTNGNTTGQIYCSAVTDPSWTTSQWVNCSNQGDAACTYRTSYSDYQSQMKAMRAAAPSDFEQFFNLMLCRNLEFWGNGLPFVPVRYLLRACAKAWNLTHLGPQVCIQPTTFSSPADLQSSVGSGTLAGTGGLYQSTIPGILSPIGGWLDVTPQLSNSPPLCVNTGPSSGASITSSTTSSLATAAVAVPAVAAIGTFAYSYATGQAVETVVKNAWRWLTKG